MHFYNHQIYPTVHEETPICVDVLDVDGFLADIDIQAVPEVPKTTLKDHSRDVDHFFLPSIRTRTRIIETVAYAREHNQLPTSFGCHAHLI